MAVDKTYTEADPLITARTLAADLRALGVEPGMTLIVHSSLKAVAGTGFVAGGPQAVIEALLAVLTPSGTLVMPAHTTDNSDPGSWKYPPVPLAWQDTIRAEWPAYHPDKTPTRMMGAIAELFRRWPGVVRSGHPVASFAAIGPNAAQITSGDPRGDDLGPDSPVGQVYALGGHVLLLGVGHYNNTSLHLAEHYAKWPGKTADVTIAAMIVDGQRQRVEIRDESIESRDFPALGARYEASRPGAVRIGKIGAGVSRLMAQRPIVDFGKAWCARERPFSLIDHASE